MRVRQRNLLPQNKCSQNSWWEASVCWHRHTLSNKWCRTVAVASVLDDVVANEVGEVQPTERGPLHLLHLLPLCPGHLPITIVALSVAQPVPVATFASSAPAICSLLPPCRSRGSSCHRPDSCSNRTESVETDNGPAVLDVPAFTLSRALAMAIAAFPFPQSVLVQNT